jgi:hypothetical protein
VEVADVVLDGDPETQTSRLVGDRAAGRDRRPDVVPQRDRRSRPEPVAARVALPVLEAAQEAADDR